MPRLAIRIAASCVALMISAGGGVAGTTTYDINYLLHQPHPFAGALAENSATAEVPRSQLYAPARMPAAGPMAYPGRPAATPSADDIRPPVAQLAQREDWSRHVPFVSEVRGGVLVHDQGPFSSSEEDGYDINFEILFTSPDFLKFIWSPRPHIGGNVNLSGDTSQGYIGLSWEWSFWRGWFAGFSLGGAIHDGELRTSDVDRKELGCRVLFRESVEAGYRFAGRHSVSLYLDHISNARLCSANEGLENFGLRYGYRF